MKINENQNASTIYYRPLKQWIEVTPEQKRDWERFVGAARKAKQRAGACCIHVSYTHLSKSMSFNHFIN